MAKSQAKKKREKQLRESGFDITIRRGNWGSLNPLTKQTKTKKELLTKMEKKHRKDHSHRKQENGLSLFFIINQNKK